MYLFIYLNIFLEFEVRARKGEGEWESHCVNEEVKGLLTSSISTNELRSVEFVEWMGGHTWSPVLLSQKKFHWGWYWHQGIPSFTWHYHSQHPHNTHHTTTSYTHTYAILIQLLFTTQRMKQAWSTHYTCSTLNNQAQHNSPFTPLPHLCNFQENGVHDTTDEADASSTSTQNDPNSFVSEFSTTSFTTVNATEVRQGMRLLSLCIFLVFISFLSCYPISSAISTLIVNTFCSFTERFWKDIENGYWKHARYSSSKNERPLTHLILFSPAHLIFLFLSLAYPFLISSFRVSTSFLWGRFQAKGSPCSCGRN